MRLARLAAVLVAVCLLGPTVSAQAGPSSVLAATPPRLAYDAGLGPRAAPPDASAETVFPADAAGPRARGAWRGAKRGFLIGVGVGAVATLATFVIADRGDARCEYVCAALIPAVMTVPLTALTTGIGAAVGAAGDRSDRVQAPAVLAP